MTSLILASLVLAAQGGYVVDAAWPSGRSEVKWKGASGVAIDGKDNVWVLVRGTPTVRKFTPDGKLALTWGDKYFKKAHHIRIDGEGFVWISDVDRHVVRKCTPEGKVVLTLGTKNKKGETEKRFNKPTDMAIAANGDIFVSDGYGNSRVVHFDSKGKFVKTWGKRGTKPGEFNEPHAIAIDSKGRLYVGDRKNGRIQIFDTSGKFLSEWKDKVVPWGIWVTKDDEIWVCGSSKMPSSPPQDQYFVKFNTDGKVLDSFTVPLGRKAGECDSVHAMAIDSKGNLYASDVKGERIQKFSPKK